MNTIGGYSSTNDMMTNYFNAANAVTARSMERISSGQRINSAADDPAGLAVGEKMNAQLTGIARASQNTQDAISLVRTADSVLGDVSTITKRMTELATQAGNGIYNTEQRSAMQEEFNQLSQEINRIGKSANFNGNKLFDGSTYTMQVGENAGDTREVKLGELSTEALGLDGIDLTSQEGASKALEAIKKADSGISSQRGSLGAMENGMQHAYNNMVTTYENLSESVSRIMGADMAKEMMNFAKSNVLSQTSMAMMGQMRNMMQYNVTQLLK